MRHWFAPIGQDKIDVAATDPVKLGEQTPINSLSRDGSYGPYCFAVKVGIYEMDSIALFMLIIKTLASASVFCYD